MEEVYKRHIIQSGAADMLDSGKWKPIAQVDWTEDGTERVKLWMEWCFTRSFATYKDAKWKPTFSPKTGLIIRTEFPLHKDPHTARRMLRAARRLSRERTHQTTNPTRSQ